MDYRRAEPLDSGSIADLIQQTWGNAVAPAWIEELLANSSHVVWIALTVDGQCAGFCASFMTRDMTGTLRWEIDLLAVHPLARRRGIGRALVAKCVAEGWRRHAAVQRALISIDNEPSGRCFAANRFVPEAPCDLWVGAPRPPQIRQRDVDGGHLISVDTLTYRGVWLESRFDEAALHAAHEKALTEGRTVVGAVISVGSLTAAIEQDLTHVDRYCWWVLHR